MITFFVFACVGAIALPFVGYPFLLWVHAKWMPRAIVLGDETPNVDLLIAAHDEEASIGARLENALALDYPHDRLTIWVASDGSTDRTVEIARSFEPRGVRVLDLARGGKAAALEAMVARSESEILAFTDANTEWTPEALRELIRPFADAAVGGVAGDQRYVAAASTTDGTAGERGYWSFDRLLKRWQSEAGNTISATGAIYAIRRVHFEPPPPDGTDDFSISTGVIAQGKRLVFCESAIAIEPPAEPNAGEFRRKVRITTRGLRAVLYRRGLLNPARTGLYAIELLVHKLWRRLTWIPLLGLALVAPLTVPSALAGIDSTTFSIVSEFDCLAAGLAGGALFVVLAGALAFGIPSVASNRLFAIARYVVMVNAACAVATVNTLRGTRVARWDTERLAADPVGRAE